MAQVGAYITGPYQGVSQAPPQVRLAEQAEALEDCFVGIPQGLILRPPLSFQAKLASHPGVTDGVFKLLEADDQNYLLTITQESGQIVPRLYPTAGLPLGYTATGLAPVAITISTAAQAYLNSGAPTPQTDLFVLNVEDYTFIGNRKVVVAPSASLSAARPHEAIVWVKAGEYNRGYSVTVTKAGGSPVTASLYTRAGDSSGDGKSTDTDAIATALATGSTGGIFTGDDSFVSGSLNSLTGAGFTVTLFGSVIYISHPTTDFTIAVKDGQAGLAMIVVKDKVESVADLPKRAQDGFLVKVTQRTTSDADDFYLTYKEPSGEGTGVWEETVGPSVSLGFDPTTMPMRLIKSGGTWQLDVSPWKPRDAGDATLAPDPDFVGRVLRDLTFYGGRLSPLSAEEVILSAADDPFRFYPRTLSSVLDSDPIELISPTPGKSTFRYILEYDSRLIAFGDKSQAALDSTTGLTLDTVKFRKASDFEFAGLAPPQVVGSKLYFLAPRGTRWSVVYELTSSRDNGGNYVLLGEDMTAAVPKYLPAGIDRVAKSPVNYLILYGKSGTQQLFPHLFRYAEQQRVQNAWQRWNLPGNALLGGMDCLNTTGYVLVCYGAEAYLVVVDLSPDALDDDSALLLTHSDFRVTDGQVTVAYSALVDQTTITLPWSVPTGSTARITVRAPGGPGGPVLEEGTLPTLPEGYLGTVISATGTTVVVSGDWTALPFWVGLVYTARFRLSTIYPKHVYGDTPIRSGRCSLRKLTVDLADTGYLRAEVTPAGRPTYTYEFTGLTWDDPESLYDVPPFATGKFSVPVQSDTERVTIDFVSDSHLGFKLLGYDYTAELNPKTGRI